jgi:hypothetical protein
LRNISKASAGDDAWAEALGAGLYGFGISMNASSPISPEFLYEIPTGVRRPSIVT